jgi:hypothetical protein
MLLQLANDKEHRFLLGVSIIRENIYTDDILIGIDTLEELLMVKEQTEALLQAASN